MTQEGERNNIVLVKSSGSKIDDTSLENQQSDIQSPLFLFKKFGALATSGISLLNSLPAAEPIRA